jgi:uncharacterized protein
MSVQFAQPFALTSSGSVATTSDPNDIAEIRVQSVIGTYPGERVMEPDYGVNLPGYLFSSDVTSETDLIVSDISTQLNKWEPSITVDTITPVTVQSDIGLSQVNIEFTISNDPTLTPAQVATVLVGGTVVNN